MAFATWLLLLWRLCVILRFDGDIMMPRSGGYWVITSNLTVMGLGWGTWHLRLGSDLAVNLFSSTSLWSRSHCFKNLQRCGLASFRKVDTEFKEQRPRVGATLCWLGLGHMPEEGGEGARQVSTDQSWRPEMRPRSHDAAPYRVTSMRGTYISSITVVRKTNRHYP